MFTTQQEIILGTTLKVSRVIISHKNIWTCFWCSATKGMWSFETPTKGNWSFIFGRSGFLISHHGSFMGALPCWTWIVSWLCNLTGCCSVSLRIEKELIPFQETSTIGSSEKSLSYTVEHQVWISYITPWLLHGGRFHVGLGLFRGFVISQAAAQCHSVLRKNLFLFKRLPLSGHQKIKSLSYTVEHQVITQNIPLQ
ncbi:uncharacterized protein [Montipora capricornis]|uniref:uncharacterized protein isoform X2 n=1 Tax=Montipora capricornis TaxID=246305 RepID=UPI0035F1CD3F